MEAEHAPTLSIVIPCWNEADGLPSVLRVMTDAAQAAEDAHGISAWEIVAVDDGSVDGTPELLTAAADRDLRIRVVTHPVNRGLGGAVRSGLAAATGDLLLYTDADMPCDIAADLPRAIRLSAVYRADVVAAYRRNRAGEGPRRAVYSAAYNALARSVFRLPARDVNFAFKLVRRRVLERLDLRSEGSFIDVELLAQAHAAGFKIVQFGTDYLPRTRGVSTLSSYRTIAKIVHEMVTVGAHVRSRTAVRGGSAHARPDASDEDASRLLVVNADDFGLTPGTAEGILRAHESGIVTSTSVLVLGRGFRAAGRALVQAHAAGIGIGVHLAVVGEDPPLLSAAEIPTLVDRRGRLSNSWRGFVSRAASGQLDPTDIEREFRAQIAATRNLGVPISHLDTHQHVHLWPLVGDVVIRLAVEHEIRALRVPRSTVVFKGRAINGLAERLSRKAANAGLVFPRWAAGLDEAGRMHGDRLRASIATLRERDCDVELGCHPGDATDTAPYRWGYHWDRELRALTSPEARTWVQRAGFQLGSYHDLIARSA